MRRVRWIRWHSFRLSLALGVTAGLLCVGAASHGPMLPSQVAPRSIAIPFVLAGVSSQDLPTGGIVESPTTLGIADSQLYTQSNDDIVKTLDKLQALGVKDIRVGVPWIYIERNDDQFDWTKMDFVVQQANARGMNVVGVVSATPIWAGFPLNGHPNPNEYAEFAGLVAERYDGDLDADGDGNDDEGVTTAYGKIAAYEIWNEPNGALFWNPVSASAYTELLKAGATAIRGADEDAVVIAGVLGAVRTIPGLSQSPESFLAEMYQNGAASYFDAISYHPYHYTLPFSQGEDQADSPVNQVEAIRALMIQYEGADTTKKIWVTEYGLPTNGLVTEQEQADFIRDFVVAWQQVEGAGPIFIYTTRDSNTGAFDDEENFGIFKTNWTEKKAVQVLRDLYADLADGVLDDTFSATSNTNLLEQLALVARQAISLLLIVPRAVFQLAVSAVTAVGQLIGQTIGALFGGVTAPNAVMSARADLDDHQPTVPARELQLPEPTVSSASAERHQPGVAESSSRVRSQLQRDLADDRAQDAETDAAGQDGEHRNRLVTKVSGVAADLASETLTRGEKVELIKAEIDAGPTAATDDIGKGQQSLQSTASRLTVRERAPVLANKDVGDNDDDSAADGPPASQSTDTAGAD